MSPLESIEEHLAAQLLSASGYAQYRSGKVSKNELAPFVTELRWISQSYVNHAVGTTLSSPIRNITAAEAYALYYTVINAAKIVHLLPLLSFPSREISVLDIGCGPGTAGLALLSSLARTIRLTCVENSQAMRVTAERLLSKYKGNGALSGLEMSAALKPHSGAQFDLVIAANVLAELRDEEGQTLALQLAAQVAPNGYLVLLEPGQQRHTRRLMSLRNSILENVPALVPKFPCPRADSCPMLVASPTDWCHGTIEWRQPRLNAQLDEALSFNKHRIKYSGFVFQRNGCLPNGMRVITNPEKGRAGIEATLCGERLYGTVRIRKGNRSEANRALEKASVFDLLRMAEPCLGDIDKTVSITKIEESQ